MSHNEKKVSAQWTPIDHAAYKLVHSQAGEVA